MNPSSAGLPVAVIGAGPIGLAAAAHLVQRGATPLVLEAGDRPGAGVLAWPHVRMFSPWEFNVDPLCRGLLEAAGWAKPPASGYPTGAELVERYLAPLAGLPALAPHVRLGTRVVGVSRPGLDRMKTAGRGGMPFTLHVVAAGREERLLARAVIDASGTTDHPAPLGADGLPAAGERALAGRIRYGIPDVLGGERARYAGRRTLVVGSGHSAFNTLLDLTRLAEAVPGGRVVWAIRRDEVGAMFGGGEADALPERGRLGQRLRQLVEEGRVVMNRGFRLTALADTPQGIVAEADGRRLPAVDEVVCATGFRPDWTPLSEVRLALDPILESPAALAPLIDPNVHSCGTVPPHGEAMLRQPEPDFYLAGMKSYGRAPNFLMLTGYEQVRSIACALTGDARGAAAVELTLPETGVCSGGGPLPEPAAAGCCGPSEPAIVGGLAIGRAGGVRGGGAPAGG